MTPAARVQASIDLLDDILAGSAVEKALTGWARRSRFAGSKDRAAVRDHVFQALRCRRSYACLGGSETGRGIMIGALRAAGTDLGSVFTGEGYAPAPLTPDETGTVQAPLNGGQSLDLPDWLLPLFNVSLGGNAEQTALALRERAPVMLRANLRKTAVDQVLSKLAEDGIVAEPDPIAKTALRVVEGERRIASSSAYLDGFVELQDGSSQAAVETLTIPAGARILDYCAGGGGKVLAMAGLHEARWFAHDALPQRMKDLPERATRAGVSVTLLETADLEAQDSFDLVLCDVPCSGSGTWRRSPDAKWRFTPDRLKELQNLQSDILHKAAGLVASGGVLAYSTCSVLIEENEGQIADFAGQTPGWAVRYQKRWPVSEAGDGFFVALLSRV
ncbi:Ribosomal RNA small subunit methyltransferase B [Roseovarius litorisediminis]|uniref:Ribosomal RNA small subunit methyltransferase B n=1 Tax=Roseovarius litorisediminis TaxID=1312363 RepID=A0A1Y5R8X5_9RHOB|nr:RsmB/NOP family class I SAM-dependent RNA methyltransferase [Roseovarius litorisediminis]SLN11875.1 Ribosomal RNA small subunit methyltransferase B [Roseovarius litorisediminis]